MSLASTNIGMYLVQGGAATKTYGMDQSNSTFADRLLSNDTDELGSVPEQSEPAPMQLARASGQAASAPGQNRSRPPSSSNSPIKTCHSSTASQSVHLRDSIAGLLQSEQSASHHSTASSTAFEAAQFSGFGTGGEQITSPGLIRSVRTDAMGNIIQTQPVSIAQDWGLSQQLVSQPCLGLKDSPVKQAGHRQSIDGDLNSLGVGFVNAMELQSRGGDALAATGEDSKELSVRFEARLQGCPPAGTSSGMQLGQLQLPSELKRGGSLLSEAAPQVASDSPASSGRFKQVML